MKCHISDWGCVYHACMTDDCQKTEVLKNGVNWGRGNCKIKKQTMKISNQYFVKDEFRDKSKAGTQKCACCGDECNFTLPMKLVDFSRLLKHFIKLHTEKGCNKEQIASPEWAA